MKSTDKNSRRTKRLDSESSLRDPILLREETGLPVVVAEDPLTCVVMGSGAMLDQIDLLKQITVSS